MPASFLGAPPEIIHKIVLFTVLESSVGPPGELYSLLLTCRALHRCLSLHACSSLYAQIFSRKFDSESLERRFGIGRLSPHHTKLELRRRFNALRCFRKGFVEEECLQEAFFIAFLMMLEDDGQNARQLRWAGLPFILLTFLRQRLYKGSEKNDGWPVDNEKNSLVVALLWMMTSRGGLLIQFVFFFSIMDFVLKPASVHDEPDMVRQETMELLRPYVFAAFRVCHHFHFVLATP